MISRVYFLIETGASADRVLKDILFAWVQKETALTLRAAQF